MHGSLAGPQVLKTTFTGTKGTNIVIDCEAQRLGSNLKPVVRLYNERGTQLAWSAPKNSIGGDARCVFTLPADGAYAVEVHDQLYRAGMPAFFRLKVGALQFADIVFPLAVSPASKTPIRFAASNLTATSELDSAASSYPGERASSLPAADQFTGAAPRVIVSDHLEHVEMTPAAGQLQGLGAAPVGVSGTIAVPGEEDKYLLDVTPGQNLRFKVVSHQMGTPLDGVLSIRNEQGAQLAANDDQPNTSDPGLDFAVPAGVTKLQLALADMQKKGGAEFVYRIEVTDLGRPDFDLSVDTASLIIPAGATQVIPVEIERRNYGGAIELSVSGLPAEVKVEGTKVAPVRVWPYCLSPHRLDSKRRALCELLARRRSLLYRWCVWHGPKMLREGSTSRSFWMKSGCLSRRRHLLASPGPLPAKTSFPLAANSRRSCSLLGLPAWRETFA